MSLRWQFYSKRYLSIREKQSKTPADALEVETSYVCFVHLFLEMYNKTIVEFGFCDMWNCGISLRLD